MVTDPKNKALSIANVRQRDSMTGRFVPVRVTPAELTEYKRRLDSGAMTLLEIDTYKRIVASSELTLDRSKIKVRKKTGMGTLTVVSGNSPPQALIWESSNPAFVTVDRNGNYKGVETGKADITVRTADGKKEGTCKVFVYEDINAAVGKGINILEAEGITSNYIKWGAPVLDIEELHAVGTFRPVDAHQDSTAIEISVEKNASSVVKEINKRMNIGVKFQGGVFTASAGRNFNTKTTETHTSEFIRVVGQVRTAMEVLENTQLAYLRNFMTDAFKDDCMRSTHLELLNKYGSHVLVNCWCGGLVIVDAMYTSTSRTEKESIEKFVGGSLFGYGKLGYEKMETKEIQHFNEYTSAKFAVWGGNMTATSWNDFGGKYDDWCKSVKRSPVVCGVDEYNEETTMIPIWNFVGLISKDKAALIKNEFERRCNENRVKLESLLSYRPVLTDINVYSEKKNKDRIPEPYNHAVLKAGTDRDNDKRSFDWKKGEILDCNETAGGKFINIFYKTGKFFTPDAYTNNAISDIIVLTGEKASPPPGYRLTVNKVDLSEGAGGTYHYLAYRLATASDREVIDFVGGMIGKTGDLPRDSEGRWEWVKRYENGKITGNANLNKGASKIKNPQNIHLMVRKIKR